MLASLLPLLLFALVSTITPGAGTVLVTASGANIGFRRTLPLIAGLASGLAMMAVAAAGGLAGLLLAWPSLQWLMKALGSLYLLWLACRIALSGAPRRAGNDVAPEGFVTGLWTIWANPKGWAMTLGAAASFSALAEGAYRLAALLGATFGLVAAFSLCVWAITGGLLARLIRSERQWRGVNILLGLALAATIAPIWLG